MAKKTTTIWVSAEYWKFIKDQKELGEDMEDVLRRLTGFKPKKPKGK